MGALAPVSSWIPEDDIMLKNALEAGASLESLARGAVYFSRRFSVQELQDRWHSLLYDPAVAAEASAHMIEFEHHALIFPSKSSRFEIRKDRKCQTGARKAESVRKRYYAMCKRICNEPFGSMDMSLLGATCNNNYVRNGDELPSADCMLGSPNSNHFGLQDSNIDAMHCAFPEYGNGDATATATGVTARAFCTGLTSCAEKDSPVYENNPHNFEENLALTGDCSAVEELRLSKELPVCNLFEADELDVKNPAMFNQISANEGNVCSAFGGGQVFNSPVSDCNASFHNLYSSPLTQTIWNTIEGICAPILPDIHLGEKEQKTGNTFAFPDHDGMCNPSAARDSVVHPNFNLENPMPCDVMKNSTPSTDDYFVSDSLLNFTAEEELLCMDESYIDGLSSLLWDSPNDSDMPNIAVPKPLVAPNEYPTHPEELDDKALYHGGDGNLVCSSKVQMLPSSAVNSEFPELRNGPICCTLNSEDPEIPSNDDVFLTVLIPSSPFSSVTQWKFYEDNYPTSSSAKGFSSSQKSKDGGPNVLKRNRNNFEQSHVPSQMIGSQLLSKMVPDLSTSDHGVKIEMPNSVAQHLTFRNSCPGSGGAADLSTNSLHPADVKEDVTKLELEKHVNCNLDDSYLKKQANGFHSHERCFQKSASCCKREVEASLTFHEHQALHTSIDMNVPELVVNHSPSDQREFPSENDDDIPYFSDVEAMILDMDLSPDDQDFYSSREVFIYHHEDTKRKIIRLEQAADAYMQRAIASQGAYAVLYGRYSKHFIKKPEVLLGRATGDVEVDIDLGREGCANNISRRQAIIKMDEDGFFHLKNLGRCSIFINGKEVAPKQSLNLSSNCLIEVRGMAFAFETNQNSVKQYASNITRGSQSCEHKD
ncbi:unnamed protein product [Ilex paraguariensis]|uniref:FHA domain-containing protein n=1 Tax=Ilex paraguariensis TaxID=185542 RepID=A0ABC8U9L7_9AQUA